MKRAVMRVTWANLRSFSLLPDDVKILYGQTDARYDGLLLVLEGDGLPSGCELPEGSYQNLLFVRPRMKTIQVAEVVNIVGAGLLRIDECGEIEDKPTEDKPGILASCGPPFDVTVFTGWS